MPSGQAPTPRLGQAGIRLFDMPGQPVRTQAPRATLSQQPGFPVASAALPRTVCPLSPPSGSMLPVRAAERSLSSALADPIPDDDWPISWPTHTTPKTRARRLHKNGRSVSFGVRPGESQSLHASRSWESGEMKCRGAVMCSGHIVVHHNPLRHAAADSGGILSGR